LIYGKAIGEGNIAKVIFCGITIFGRALFLEFSQVSLLCISGISGVDAEDYGVLMERS
jgi:hypothetical protein